ncbi:hypothetical protein CEXT_80851 [Caerostris extrusa]|uniref:Uncharacterized protein n=1 Tax=Caerostris extrusa TaxID=172846 RepID=A0AAV4M4G6_CAEEX|nr:hypothetical protein CEXT_80851 [Caerostris extrusa]
MAAKFCVRRVVAMVTGWGEGEEAGVSKPQQMLQLLYQSPCTENGEVLADCCEGGMKRINTTYPPNQHAIPTMSCPLIIAKDGGDENTELEYLVFCVG